MRDWHCIAAALISIGTASKYLSDQEKNNSIEARMEKRRSDYEAGQRAINRATEINSKAMAKESISQKESEDFAKSIDELNKLGFISTNAAQSIGNLGTNAESVAKELEGAAERVKEAGKSIAMQELITAYKNRKDTYLDHVGAQTISSLTEDEMKIGRYAIFNKGLDSYYIDMTDKQKEVSEKMARIAYDSNTFDEQFYKTFDTFDKFWTFATTVPETANQLKSNLFDDSGNLNPFYSIFRENVGEDRNTYALSQKDYLKKLISYSDIDIAKFKDENNKPIFDSMDEFANNAADYLISEIIAYTAKRNLSEEAGFNGYIDRLTNNTGMPTKILRATLTTALSSTPIPA